MIQYLFPPRFITVIVCISNLAFFVFPSSGDEPTLARLSFWLSPGKMIEFQKIYARDICPILEQHGLKESSLQGRTTVDGVFSRLFELNDPSEINQKNEALQKDQNWLAILQKMRESYGAVGTQDVIRHRLGLYRTPAGSGQKQIAGEGVGHWRIFGKRDGFRGGFTEAPIQDREGYLWFQSSIGIYRYDGQTTRLFTTEDGLAGNEGYCLPIIDKDGNLWVGSWLTDTSLVFSLRGLS